MSILEDKVLQIGVQAKQASKILARTSGTQKNNALLAMAKQIINSEEIILDANAIDIKNAIL